MEYYGWFMVVFNTAFNNISVISWRSVLLLEETGVPGENHRPAESHCQTLSHNVVSRNIMVLYKIRHGLWHKQDVILFFPFSIDIYKEKFLLDLITVFYLLSPKKCHKQNRTNLAIKTFVMQTTMFQYF
jgi:hypothetical protein